MLPRHLKLITSHRLPTTIRLYFLNRLMAFGFNKDILVKLVDLEGIAPSRIIGFKPSHSAVSGYPQSHLKLVQAIKNNFNLEIKY